MALGRYAGVVSLAIVLLPVTTSPTTVAYASKIGSSTQRHDRGAPRFANVASSTGLIVRATRTWGSTFVDTDLNGFPDPMIGRHLNKPIFFSDEHGAFRQLRVPAFKPPGKRRYYDRHSCAWGEANGDGRPDLYCVSGAQKGVGTGPNELLIQRSLGHYINRARRYHVVDLRGRGRTVDWFDYNRDGRLDLYVGNELRAGYPNRLFRHAHRRYRRVASAADTSIATTTASEADWNGDGRPDVIVFSHGSRGAVAYRGIHHGFAQTYLPGVSGLSWMSGSWGDYNADGWPDLALVAKDRLVVFRNHHGRLARATSLRLSQGHIATWFDADNDGDLDLFVVQGSPVRNGGANKPDLLVLKRRHGFRALHRSSFAGPNWGSGDTVSTADYDRDGRVDLLVTNGYEEAQGPVELLRNKSRVRHWIEITLRDGRFNPFAFGAKVKVKAGKKVLWSEITDGSSFRAQSETNPVHFGLGRAYRARVKVFWPNGGRSCITTSVNQVISLHRGHHRC